MSDFLGIAQKVRHFSNSCAQNCMIYWQKLAMELAATNRGSSLPVALHEVEIASTQPLSLDFWWSVYSSSNSLLKKCWSN